MILFHYCKAFKDKINDLDSTTRSKIEKKFIEYKKRENLNNIGNIESLSGGETFILKTKQPESRIIIQLCDIEKDLKVHFVRDIITNVKFDREYGRIIYSKIKKGEWIIENPLPQEEINLFKSRYEEKVTLTEEIRLQQPPENLLSWFNEAVLTLNNDIFESEDWVAYSLNNNEHNGMSDRYVNTFRIEINNIVSKNCKDLQQIDSNDNQTTYKYENNNIGIIFSKILLENKEYILLHFGAHTSTQKDYWDECNKKIYNKNYKDINSEENLYRYSYRSYPKWTLNDDELWFRIIKSDENSNLSLTTEQVNFLKNFKFPCYINGQAGSGKSTLLYYIFANIIYLKILDSIKGNIIFLTENEQLLEDSVKNVLNLLENNPEFQLNHENIIECKKYFDSFKNFLVSMLDDNDLLNFQEDFYLHFPLFKTLYESSTIKSSKKDDYSAEEAWFVISTFIYGHNVDEKITSENYEEKIPTKSRKNITLERFRDIENHILPFYENLLERGYWDKLKIIRYINKNINLDIKPKFDAIICDEAQDFCKVELSFILKQSNYLSYDLSLVEQIPIVFAGDANQTVNPTGFSDAEMTSLLYEEFQEIKFNYNSDTIFYSPNLNYRSTPQVVDLANFIQYYRTKSLGINNKLPQESKRPEVNRNESFNIFLDYDTVNSNNDLKQDLLKKLKYKIFIIPTNSEEKKEFKMNSELLSCFKDLEIKTSIESKGAEYKQVVLYGFGDYFLNNFDFNNNNNNNDFQIMYYFNKLYVAITRAKTEIVIIDSSKSKEDFWEKLICNAEITNQNAWGKLKEIQSKVIVYDTHSINNILYSTKEDALENAKEDERLGVFYQNPSRLKVAASQFLRLSKEDEANKCLGLAYEINHDYKNAADYFRKANMLELASKSLFKGLYLNELETIGKNLQSPEHELRMIISRFMSNEFITINDIERLLVNKELLVEILKNLPWYDDLLRIINLYLIENKNIDFIENLIKVVLAFIKSSDTELYNTIAELKYNFRMYKEAIEIWESIDYYTSEKYFIAKYKYYDERNDYENKVIYLHEQIQFKEDKKDKQSLYKEIIHINDKYVSEKIDDYSNEYFLIILKSLILLNEFDRVSIFIKEVEERVYPSEFEECIKNIIINEKISNNLFNYLILEWAKFIVSSEEFDNNYLNEINSIYKNKSEQLNIIYKPFEFNEIKRIIENTEDYEFNPNGHITHIIINNFRQFENLTIENIGQFNLIVGDNNVGKTSLLEALLFVNDPEVYYTNLAFAYIARNNSNLIRNNDSNIEHYDIPIEFINDFFRFNDTKNGINFILFENRQQWKFSFQTPSKEDIIRDFDIKTGINEKEFISMNIDKNCISVHELSTIIKKIDPYDIIKMQLIPFGKGFDKTLARSYFKNIDNDRSKRTTLLEAMKVFIPNIDRITADTSSGIINIEETNKNDAYPIHQYGEGANKLFRILVQLSLLKDKKLLIDEIDAGIHFSHFKRFWEIIIKVAKENNVQLFVTTHNIECIEYFKDIVEYNEEYQSLSKVITLRKLPQKDEIKAYTYNFNEFDHQIDNDFEIRGGEL